MRRDEVGQRGPRISALLAESTQWTGGKQRLTGTRLHAMLHELALGCADGLTSLGISGAESVHLWVAVEADPSHNRTERQPATTNRLSHFIFRAGATMTTRVLAAKTVLANTVSAATANNCAPCSGVTVLCPRS